MKVINLFIILFTLISCSTENENTYTIEQNTPTTKTIEVKDFKFSNYAWLNGSFLDSTSVKQEQTHEIWKFLKDSIVGNGFYIRNKNKTTPDKSVIKYKDNGIYFINTSSKNTIAEFKLTNFSNDSLVFKNPAHRYPQEVVYKKISNDNYLIIMRGYVFQQNRNITFNMVRYE